MFGFMALVSLTLPLVTLPAMAGLIWVLRARVLRAFLALLALTLAAAPYSREFLYAVGLGLPYPDEETTALGGAARKIVSAIESYGWQLLGFAAGTAVLLSWPLPERLAKRVLAGIVVVGLAVSSALAWSFTGLRFN